MSLKFANNNSLSAITSLPDSISGGAWTLLSTATASSSATLSFTSGIDSSYKEYIFRFINMHPSADQPNWTFQGSTNSGSSYGVTITSTTPVAYHAESDSEATLEYSTGSDLAQSTNYQRLSLEVNNANDGCVAGMLHLFAPSDTTFVKHFIATSQGYTDASGVAEAPYSWNMYTAGYFNTTSAINAIQFKMSSGNIDAGVIKLYGVS